MLTEFFYTKTFSVSKPAVQYANPEGGLADGTAYACGKVDENGKIICKQKKRKLYYPEHTQYTEKME